MSKWQIRCRNLSFRALLLLLFSVITTLFLSGCAATTTFSSYPSKINPLINNLQLNRPINLADCLVSETKSRDRLLYTMERGRIAQILGKIDESMASFNDSMEKIAADSLKATVSVGDLGANAAATALNDNAIPYAGDGYERVMLHHYQALNYLSKNDVEGAGVEIRRANAEQEEALRKFEDQVEEAKREAEKKNVESTIDNPAIATAYAQMDEVAGKVKNSFQNAYTFYLSGFTYELLRQPNDAYIDYKKALEIYPQNSQLRKDVVRLAAELEMIDDLEELRKRFGMDKPPALGSSAGELLILFEDGFVPQKEEVKIALPLPHIGLIAAAFPIYRAGGVVYHPLRIYAGTELLGSSEPITDFRALSVKALQEKTPILATRQAVRMVAKAAGAKLAKEKLGAFGELGMTLWNYASENADLRSWNTLPATAQIFRTALPAGRHVLQLKQNRAATDVEISVSGGGKTLLYVILAGDTFYTSSAVFPSGKEGNFAAKQEER